jgi:hypothetical protein
VARPKQRRLLPHLAYLLPQIKKNGPCTITLLHFTCSGLGTYNSDQGDVWNPLGEEHRDVVRCVPRPHGPGLSELRLRLLLYFIFRLRVLPGQISRVDGTAGPTGPQSPIPLVWKTFSPQSVVCLRSSSITRFTNSPFLVSCYRIGCLILSRIMTSFIPV